MSFMTKLIKRAERATKKDFVIAGIFSLALVASVGLGLVSRQFSSAQEARDCSTNSIDYEDLNGGCGAATPSELIKDIQDNQPSDLQNIYSYFGLTPAKYTQFANTAVEGQVNVNGTVTYNGQTVMTGVQTMGRDDFNSHRVPLTIDGHTYYEAAPQYSFAAGVTAIPAMIMFDGNGVAQAVVMNPCGNEVSGTPVTNSVTCHALNATQPNATKQPNTYNFTTTATVTGNAIIDKVVYHFSDDNSTVTEASPSTPVAHTFTKSGTVTVTVFASVPGGNQIESEAVVNCEKQITYVPPFYVCTELEATALDSENNSFRFTVIAKTDNTGQTILQNVDFTLDGTQTTKGVTQKDSNGNIYQDYSFTDTSSHTVVATLNFNTAQGVESTTCKASVTPSQPPMCTVPGHTNESPTSPTCGYCQPNIPIGSAACTPTTPVPPSTPTALVNTGPGSTIGLFGATVIVGFFAHKFYASRRARRQNSATSATL